MASKFIDNLLDRPALGSEMPDEALKELAALPFRGAIFNQIVVIDFLSASGIVKIQAAGLAVGLAGRARQYGVDTDVKWRPFGPAANFQAANCDVARRVAITLDAGTA